MNKICIVILLIIEKYTTGRYPTEINNAPNY